MNLFEGVIYQLKIPIDLEEKFVYRSEWLGCSNANTSIRLNSREQF